MNSVADWSSYNVPSADLSDWLSLVKPLQCTPGGVKTGFLGRRNNKQSNGSGKEYTVVNSSEHSVFRHVVQYALDAGFSDILDLKPVQEEALLHFIK